MIQYQILQDNTKRIIIIIIQQTVRRIAIEILGVKGLKHVFVFCNLFLHFLYTDPQQTVIYLFYKIKKEKQNVNPLTPRSV